MSKINFPKKQEQRLIPKYLLEYSEELVKNHPDPSESWGGSGSTYTAGEGIVIENNEISVDAEDVALVKNLATVAFSGSYSDLSNKPDLSVYELKEDAFSGDYNDLTNKPTLFSGNYNDLTNKPDLSVYELKSEAFSGDYDDLTDKPDLSVYELKSEAFSGNYNDLTNKPDLSVYELKSEAFSGDYDDLSNKPDLSVYELKSEAFSGDYNDLTNKPTLFSGNYNDLTNKPDLTVYELKSEAFSGNYNDLTNKPTIPTDTSDLTNGAGYITGIDSADVITALGYTPGTSNFSGNYNDLTNKPTIPTVNDPTITFTQGGVTKGTITLNQASNQTIALDAGTAPSNMVTTDTAQNITATKTFLGDKLINFKMASSSQKLGFTCYDNSGKEIGYLESRIKSNIPQMSIGIYNTQSSNYDRKLQLSYQSNNGGTTYSYNLVCPTRLQKNGSDVFMPTSFTATSATAVEATNTGSVDLTNVIEQVLRNHGLIS